MEIHMFYDFTTKFNLDGEYSLDPYQSWIKERYKKRYYYIIKDLDESMDSPSKDNEEKFKGIYKKYYHSRRSHSGEFFEELYNYIYFTKKNHYIFPGTIQVIKEFITRKNFNLKNNNNDEKKIKLMIGLNY